MVYSLDLEIKNIQDLQNWIYTPATVGASDYKWPLNTNKLHEVTKILFFVCSGAS